MPGADYTGCLQESPGFSGKKLITGLMPGGQQPGIRLAENTAPGLTAAIAQLLDLIAQPEPAAPRTGGSAPSRPGTDGTHLPYTSPGRAA